MDAGASAIAITANTGFTQLGGPITTTNSTANAVQISTTGGNASIRAISTGLGGAVTIHAGGAILDGNGADDNVTTNSLTLTAGAGIASADNPLETVTQGGNETDLLPTLTLVAQGGSGGIYLTNHYSLTIASAVTAGTITIKDYGPLLVTGSVTGSEVSLSTEDGGSLTISATAVVQTDPNKTLTLAASGDLNLEKGGQITAGSTAFSGAALNVSLEGGTFNNLTFNNTNSSGTSSTIDLAGATVTTANFNGSNFDLGFNGSTLNNLNLSVDSSSFTASGATITNAAFTNSTLSGVISGSTLAATISGSTITGTISGSTLSGLISGSTLSGVISGSTLTSAISGSAITAAISGAILSGGISGSTLTAAISNSILSGVISGSTLTSVISGSIITGALSGSTLTSAISGSILTGAISGSLLTGAISGSIITSALSGSTLNSAISGSTLYAAISGSMLSAGISGSTITSALSGSTLTSVISGSILTGALSGSVITSAISGSIITGSITGSTLNGAISGSLITSATSDLSGSAFYGAISGSALFGAISGSMLSAGISGSTIASAISGSTLNSAISGSILTGSLSGSVITSAISGSTLSGLISGSTLTATISGSTLSGGISGSTITAIISGSTLSGAISNSTITAVLSGSTISGGISGSTLTGTISGSTITSTISGSTLSSVDIESSILTGVDVENSTLNNVNVGISAPSSATFNACALNNVFFSGTGFTLKLLASYGTLVDFKNVNASDIDLTGFQSTDDPLGKFSGLIVQGSNNVVHAASNSVSSRGFLVTGDGNTITLPGAVLGKGDFVLDLSGGTLHNLNGAIIVGNNYTINLAGAMINGAVLSGGNYQVNLSNAKVSLGYFLMHGSDAAHLSTINAAGATFDLLTNYDVGSWTSFNLSNANLTTFTNNAANVTEINLDGAKFGNFTNNGNNVSNIHALVANFQVIDNEGSFVTGIKASGVDGSSHTLINNGNNVTGIDFTGGNGPDVFVLNGDIVSATFSGNGGDDTVVLGGTRLTATLDGGAGNDRYLFNGAPSGALTIRDAYTGASDPSVDTLDFSSFTAGPIVIDLAQTTQQTLWQSSDGKQSLAMTLGDGVDNASAGERGIENVVGTGFSDTILGNARNNTLLGAALPDSRLAGQSSLWNGRTQIVFLDFDSYTNREPGSGEPNYDPLPGGAAEPTGEIVYTLAERQAIAAQLAKDFQGFPVQFYYSTALDSSGTELTGSALLNQLGTDRQKASNASINTGGNGVYATVYFNKSRRVPGAEAGVPFHPIYDPSGNIVIDLQPGGESNEVDFGNQNFAGLVSVQINGIVGGAAQGQADPTFNNIVNSSANLAAHETGHLLGLRHADSFAPISLGVHNPPGILAYDPSYPGPAAAFETNWAIMASNGATGMTFTNNNSDLFVPQYFSERSLVKLAFDYSAPIAADGKFAPDGKLVVAEQAAAHGTTATAQAVNLAALTVPDTMPRGLNAGKDFYVGAVDVLGAISTSGQTDVYAVQGKAGDVLNLEVISNGLLGKYAIADTIDPVLTVLDASGKVLTYFTGSSKNNNQFETSDASLIDLILPADGTYYVQVTAQASDPTGNYELFLYRFSAANKTSGNDIVVGQDGNDIITGGKDRSILIGGTGADTITAGAGDDIVVSGTTTYDHALISGYLKADSDAAAPPLARIRREWTRTDLSYQNRVNDVMVSSSSSYNGSYVLVKASASTGTVLDDNVVDTLTGNAGQDLFYSGVTQDVITDPTSNEKVVNLKNTAGTNTKALIEGDAITDSGSVALNSLADIATGPQFVSIQEDDGSAVPADLQARIEDALTYWNDTFGYLGTTLIEVSAGSDAADFRIHISDTSILGGVAEGVLGCTTEDGNIELIKGWNWYAGSDPTVIGSDQFDFQTIATHELGHALGLGHSPDASSVMYPDLSAGVVKRALTAQDLTVPDSDGGGAHALHAVRPGGIASPASSNGEGGQAPADPLAQGPQVGPALSEVGLHSVGALPLPVGLAPNGLVVSALSFGDLRFFGSADLLPDRFGARQRDGGPVLSVGLAASGPGVSALSSRGTPGSISFFSGDDLLPDDLGPANPASGEESAANVDRQGKAPARIAVFAELTSSGDVATWLTEGTGLGDRQGADRSALDQFFSNAEPIRGVAAGAIVLLGLGGSFGGRSRGDHREGSVGLTPRPTRERKPAV